MEAACRAVIETGATQTSAARDWGVSRPRLNEKVKAQRALNAEAQERSVETRLERAGAPSKEPALGLNERRRVPPPVEFNELYFNNVYCSDCGDIQHETPFFHKEMLTALGDHSIKRLLVNLPPFHAKSTLVSLRHPLWAICNDPNVRIALISAGSSMAEDQAYQIQRHLTDPELYRGASRNLVEDWGPFQGVDKWTRKEFWVTGRISPERDPTVRTYGIGSKIYGRRIDEAILDDVFDLSNTRNPDTVAFNVKWITSEVESRVGKSGSLKIVGTRVGSQDGYSSLQKLPGYHVIRYPCIIDEETGLTLWPEHFDIDAAKLKRSSMNADLWQLLYQNAETLGESASFTEDMLNGCHDQTRSLGEYDSSWAQVAGIDPAGANKQSGFTAGVCLGVDLKTGRRYLVDIFNSLQLKAPQLKQQIFQWAETYPLREFRVENNGVQAQLVQYNDEIIVPLNNRGIRVTGHHTGRNKSDPNFGIEGMAPMFFNHTISMPWKDINSRHKVQQLEQQLLTFPLGQTTDIMMALWFANEAARELYQRALLPAYDPKFKIPKRMKNKRAIIDFSKNEVRAPTMDEQSGWTSRWATDDYEPESRKPLNVGLEEPLVGV